MENKENDSERKRQETINIPIPAEKMIPKFCTTINIALLKNKSLILSLIYNENKENGALIERVVIDLDHAKSLNDALTKLLKDAENEGITNTP